MFATGGLAAPFITVTEVEAVGAELRAWNPRGLPAVAVKAFGQVWKLQVVPPALQHGLVLHLAGFSGLFAGSLRDRPGVVAVGYIDEVRHHRQMLVFDARTGGLTSTEDAALEGSTLPVPIPSTFSETEWVDSGYCSTTTGSP